MSELELKYVRDCRFVVDNKRVGKLAQKHRESLGVSQEAVGKFMPRKTSAQYISACERGQKPWTQGKLDAYKAACAKAAK